MLALLADQERKFDRERAAWRDERERLLDRIMLLADKPTLDTGPFQQTPPEEPDVLDPDQELGDDLWAPPHDVFPDEQPVFVQAVRERSLSPRERMLRDG